MSARPVLYDLCCKAGGAAMGYHRAGFDVVGVDIKPQPHYPFEFHQADALRVLDDLIVRGEPWPGARWPAAIHASPPCQTFARVTAWRGDRDDHPDLLTPTLALLARVSQPWIVENVPEAAPPLRADYMLCGTHFALPVRRHRIFQAGNWTPPFELLTSCQCYRNRRLLPFMHKGERAYADAMGCTWMTKEEARQAIPPAYTEHIGRQLLDVLAVTT